MMQEQEEEQFKLLAIKPMADRVCDLKGKEQMFWVRDVNNIGEGIEKTAKAMMSRQHWKLKEVKIHGRYKCLWIYESVI